MRLNNTPNRTATRSPTFVNNGSLRMRGGPQTARKLRIGLKIGQLTSLKNKRSMRPKSLQNLAKLERGGLGVLVHQAGSTAHRIPKKKPKKAKFSINPSPVKIQSFEDNRVFESIEREHEISSIFYEGENIQEKTCNCFFENRKDKTLIKILGLLNLSEEAKSNQGASAGQQRCRKQPKKEDFHRKNPKKQSFQKSKKRLFSHRSRPLKKSLSKFRIKIDSQHPLKHQLMSPISQRRRFALSSKNPKNRPKNAKNGLQFITRISRKTKTIITKSPVKRKRFLGRFNENPKIQFLGLSKSIDDNSRSSTDKDSLEEEVSTSKIEILQDEDYLTNKRQILGKRC